MSEVLIADMSSPDASRLPRWRYNLRQKLIPFVRAETPYLALLQDKMRSPLLDSYFAITANLGTHTFYMASLPVLFWCGYTNAGRAMVHMLANGVFWSGWIKDMLCLPRPLSPPLQRITMSGSAALEYGFPSTHATNAISVAMYVLYALHGVEPEDRTMAHTAAQIGFCWYAMSIILGRLYCGMHGFSDVVIGSGLGAIIAAVEILWGEAFQNWLIGSSYLNPIILTLVILVLIRSHPEPADNCPCFDDSVAFAAVVIGIEVGNWHFASTRYSWNTPVPATIPFQLETIGYFKAAVRIVLGVLIVFAWRGIMKPTLLKSLPPIFRVIESLGVDLPRKFFLKASEYSTVPRLRKDDNIIPPALEIPKLLSTKFSNPLRRRAVSIGPQSEADAWETIAYRQKRRRESLGLSRVPTINTVPEAESTSTAMDTNIITPTISEPPPSPPRPNAPTRITIPTSTADSQRQLRAELPTPMASRVQSYEKMMGSTGPEAFPDFFAPPLTPPAGVPSEHSLYTPNGTVLNIGVRGDPLRDASEAISDDVMGAMRALGVEEEVVDEEDEKRELIEEREIFQRVQTPRVRYDVEVVTKLIVYAGEFAESAMIYETLTSTQALHGYPLKPTPFYSNGRGWGWDQKVFLHKARFERAYCIDSHDGMSYMTAQLPEYIFWFLSDQLLTVHLSHCLSFQSSRPA